MPIIGTAPNKTFQRSDGTRTGSAVNVQAKTAGVKNTAASADYRENDIAAALNVMVMKDGGNQPSADLPMGGYKHTGCGDATANDQYATKGQVDAGFQPLDADLTALAALAGTGLAARTAANTWAQRTITGTAGQIVVTNGDGAGGNPTLSLPAGVAFPAGTPLLFPGVATAPTGWTKVTNAAYSDAALRVVTGATAGTGGTAAFSTVFASRTPTGTVGGHTLTANEIPAHTHTGTTSTSADHSHPLSTDAHGFTAGGITVHTVDAGASTNTGAAGAHNHTFTTDPTGGGLSHDHTWTGVAMDFAVKYVDSIIATKD